MSPQSNQCDFYIITLHQDQKANSKPTAIHVLRIFIYLTLPIRSYITRMKYMKRMQKQCLGCLHFPFLNTNLQMQCPFVYAYLE